MTRKISNIEKAHFEKILAERLQKDLKKQGRDLSLFECLCVVKSQIVEGVKHLEKGAA